MRCFVSCCLYICILDRPPGGAFYIDMDIFRGFVQGVMSLSMSSSSSSSYIASSLDYENNGSKVRCI